MNPNFHLETAVEKLEPSLKALQKQYKEIIEKYQPVVDHAAAQLTYVEGILSGFSSIPTRVSESSKKSTTEILPAPASETPVQSPSEEPVVNVGNSEVTPKIKAPRKPSKFLSSSKSLNFLSEYKGETLTSAVQRILEERRGEEVGIEEVVTALYGNIDIERFKVAKDRVTKNLSKGKVTGLWDRVDNKSGFYTAKP
jgi:hypothetical protein